MASIADLKKKTASLSSDKLKDQMADSDGSGGSEDDRIWRPHFDKEKGTARARIRFLPPHADEDVPFVKVYRHGFKGPNGKWYINNSLTTFKKPDPVTEMNGRLWNSGVEKNKDVARKYKRQTNYYSNVLVVDDPANPDNNGKVFIYRYGAMVYEMIKKALDPEFEDDAPINPFDVFEGADLEIRMYTDSHGYVKYDKSMFKEPGPLGDEDYIEEVWNKCYRLQEFLAPENFKSYDTLAEELFTCLGSTVGVEGSEVPVVLGADIEKEDRNRSNTRKEEPTTSTSEELDDEIPSFDSDDSNTDSGVSSSNPDDEFDSLFDD